MDLIAIFDEWAARAALVLGLFATVVALLARRDAGFRKAWSVEHREVPTGLPSGETKWVAHVVNTTRDRAEVTGLFFSPTIPIGFNWPQLDPGESFEVDTTRIDGIVINWKRPGKARVYRYMHRPMRTPWKYRIKEAWNRLRDVPR
ncbi:hypothetical protein [Pseudoclavibacter sp. RFBB5]|uniref:hypothetical protein n=1 Tax=Pseudoclavibacter sp. RFBB5 TaxID=2080574 RepID=UPI0011B00A56|nr:hypothetical protein [Pseudoclavibacter sp. RFBB5]